MKRSETESFLLLEKIREQITLACNLVSLIPVSALEWRPAVLEPSTTDQQYCPPAQQSNRTSEATEPPTVGLLGNPATSDDYGLLRVGELLGHLLDCAAGFCALLYSINKGRLSHFQKLRGLPINHSCGIEEARSRLAEYMAHIEEGFDCLEDSDLSERIPTVFVPEGEPVLTLLLGNLEHLINHKFQLFIYLRLLGVNVGTKDLYRIRGEAPPGK